MITKTNKIGQGNFWTQENLKRDTRIISISEQSIATVNLFFVEASGVPVSLPTDIFDDLDNTIREAEAFKQLDEN